MIILNDRDLNNDFSEKELIVALKHWNRAAFEDIFTRYHKRLYFFCYSFLKNKEDAENITQDVFVKIWINKSQIDEERSFSGLLFIMAKNLIINHIRKSVNRQKFIDYIINHQQGKANQTESDVSYHEINEILKDLIRRLPPKRREIFILSRQKGLSHIEIATKLGISIHTVESQLTKALKFIRKGLNDVAPFM